MISDSTISNVPPLEPDVQARGAGWTQLVIVTLADDPLMPSSRHLLDDLDEVRFGRGARDATRAVRDGRRVLQLRIPDPRMSAEHGQLVRGPNGWVFHDPSSKNGSLVDGELTRRALVADGTLLELGHTFLRVCVSPVEPAATDDVMAPAGPAGLTTFVGPLAERFAALQQIADTRVPVLLQGETGTGKEVVARALHQLSRRGGSFVAVNCGALPAALIEGELFGSRRGAYTHATSDRLGLIRSADQGTLFLDEIGELPIAGQAALLRVLQDYEVTPVGGDRPVKVDPRVCVATLRDLPGLVESGGFRQDLYARLLGFSLTLPPLRARMVDLGLIVADILPRVAVRRPVRFTAAAVRAISRHDWPLNIRELERALATACALAVDGVIDVAQLQVDFSPRAPASPVAAPAPELSGRDRALRDRLVSLLTVHDGNVVIVARELGSRRQQVYRWAHRFGLDITRFRKL